MLCSMQAAFLMLPWKALPVPFFFIYFQFSCAESAFPVTSQASRRTFTTKFDILLPLRASSAGNLPALGVGGTRLRDTYLVCLRGGAVREKKREQPQHTSSTRDTTLCIDNASTHAHASVQNGLSPGTPAVPMRQMCHGHRRCACRRLLEVTSRHLHASASVEPGVGVCGARRDRAVAAAFE